MTTPEREAFYAAEHVMQWGGQPLAVYNPNSMPPDDLPVIYGFNNGGDRIFLNGVIFAQDGEHMGGHTCSDECYMPHDLGCIEGSRPDRHEKFREKYPDGYRMEFVSASDVRGHAGLMEAYRLNQLRRPTEEE